MKKYADTSVIVCDEIINAIDNTSTNVTNTIPTIMTKSLSINVTSAVSINSGDKKTSYKVDCYILHTFLLVITLLLIIAIIYYH